MHPQSATKENTAAVLIPETTPAAPWRVVAVEALPQFRLRVAFKDGLTGIVDMSRLVHSPAAGVFSVLADTRRFTQVALEYGVVTWPGELDLAPDAMHAAIREHGEWVL